MRKHRLAHQIQTDPLEALVKLLTLLLTALGAALRSVGKSESGLWVEIHRSLCTPNSHIWAERIVIPAWQPSQDT